MFYHLKIAVRNLRQNSLFTILNIAGLAVGMTVVLIICAMIFNEYSFDKSFQNRSRIYRVNTVGVGINEETVSGFTAPPFAPAAEDEIPEVEFITRTCISQAVVKLSDDFFKIEKFCWADKDFFRIFETPFIYGSPETALLEHGSVALSESKAAMLFGDLNPIGENILIDGINNMVVRAVYKDFPSNSSFADYSVIGQFLSSHLPITPRDKGYYHWGNIGFETFCLLIDGVDSEHAEEQMQQLLEKNKGGIDGSFSLQLQPFEKIHLYPVYGTNIYAPGDINRLKMLFLLAVIILTVACINYMNLSTARAQKRSKEIGINKTLGARRSAIMNRLFVETGVVTLIAFVSAFLFSILLLPVFNDFLEQHISPGVFLNPVFLLGLTAVYLITVFVSASYPAIYLSGFAPLTIIRQGYTKGGSHAIIRKGLSVIQFSVAVILITCVIIISSQIKYITDKDLGYDVSGVIAIELDVSSQNDYAALKNDFAAQSSVLSFSMTSAFPLWSGTNNIFFKNLQARQETFNGKQPSSDQISYLGLSYATPDILEMLNLKLISGSMYLKEKSEGEITQAVVNRKTLEFLETTPEEIIGKTIYAGGIGGGEAYVTGVVEDFNFKDLRTPIGPYCFQNSRPGRENVYLLMRVNDDNLSEQLATYEAIYKKHFPDKLFEAYFPSIRQQRVYDDDRQTNRMAICFSILAILVACMGVFGLTAFMAEQRTKEIAIRKVLGASVGSVLQMFTNSYIRLLALSLLIAIPVAWQIGNRYLQDFAYRIDLGWWIFAAAALITVVVTLLTVCFQAIKTAIANPVKSLKTE